MARPGRTDGGDTHNMINIPTLFKKCGDKKQHDAEILK